MKTNPFVYKGFYFYMKAVASGLVLRRRKRLYSFLSWFYVPIYNFLHLRRLCSQNLHSLASNHKIIMFFSAIGPDQSRQKHTQKSCQAPSFSEILKTDSMANSIDHTVCYLRRELPISIPVSSCCQLITLVDPAIDFLCRYWTVQNYGVPVSLIHMPTGKVFFIVYRSAHLFRFNP